MLLLQLTSSTVFNKSELVSHHCEFKNLIPFASDSVQNQSQKLAFQIHLPWILVLPDLIVFTVQKAIKGFLE